jgi:hypothetical protein
MRQPQKADRTAQPIRVKGQGVRFLRYSYKTAKEFHVEHLIEVFPNERRPGQTAWKVA